MNVEKILIRALENLISDKANGIFYVQELCSSPARDEKGPAYLHSRRIRSSHDGHVTNFQRNEKSVNSDKILKTEISKAKQQN